MRSKINLLITTLLPFLFLLSGNFTKAQINSFPYLEDFESFTLCGPSGCNANCTGAVANGWVQDTTDQQDWRIDNNGTSSSNTGPAVDHTLGNSTGQYLFTEASSCNNQTHILFSPYFDLTGLSSPQLEFWVHMAGGNMGTMTMEYAVGANGTWTILWSQTGAIQSGINDPWVKIDTSLASIAADSMRFRLTGVTGSGFESDMAFDDFRILNVFPNDIGVAEILHPSGLLFPTCSYTASETISVVIENFGSDSASNFPVAYRINGGTPVQETFNGTLLSGAMATFSFAAPANLATPGNYDIEAYTLLANDSVRANDTAFSTAQNVLISAYPYLQDFENLSPCSDATGPQTCDLSSEGWVQGENGIEDDDDWRVNNGGTGSGSTGPDDDRTFGNGTGHYIYTEASGTSNRRNIVYSPCFQITGLTNPILAFFYHMYGTDMGTLWVEVTANGGATWDTLWTQSGQVQTSESDPWELEIISLSAYNNQTISFRFNGLTGPGFTSDIALDDIYVGEDGLCFNPSLTVGQVDTTFAVLGFTSVNDTAATFIIEYGPAGFTPGTGTVIVVNSASDTLTGLQDFTEYDVYIAEICGSDTTSQVGPASFTTLCIPETIGDSDTSAFVINAFPFTDTLDTRCYTDQFTTQGSNDVYYTLTTGPCTDSLFISTCSPLSQYDTYLYLLDSAGATVAANDDATVGTCGFTLNGLNRFSIINTAVQPNTQYFIIVDGFGTSVGQYELTVDESTFGPQLSTDLVSNIACNGDSTGSIQVSVAGGAGAYTYSWTNGDTIEDISGLPAGTYTLMVSDTQGCDDSETYVITEPPALVVSEVTDDVDCFGGSDGSISLTVTGGTPGYSYAWNTGDSTDSISGLTANTYSVVTTDSNGCTSSNSYVITEPAALAATAAVTDESSSGASDGAIDLTPTGGTAGYVYAWSNGATTEDISGLSGGVYCVTITDVNNCTFVYCDTVSTLISVNIPNLNAFELYPNPASANVKVSVELDATSDVELEILNLTGQVILSRKDEAIDQKIYELDLMEYAQGTYLVRLKVNGRSITRPLIISR